MNSVDKNTKGGGRVSVMRLVIVLTGLLGAGLGSAETIFRDYFELSFRDCAECPRMVRIPAGEFQMGAPFSEPGSNDWERPVHTVNVPAFAIGQREVTFDEWDACLADGGCTHDPDDRGWGRGARPVINVSWEDAQEYVDWLSARTGQDYRLPSEAEWEYAARAGTSGRFNTGECLSTDQANFNGLEMDQGCAAGQYRMRTVPVGSFAPNAFGLHDTHGNVWEWVDDCWNEDYQGAPTDGSAWMEGDCEALVARGGAYLSEDRHVRSAHRVRAETRIAGVHFAGFRVVRSLQQ